MSHSKEQSTEELIGWIVGIIVALGLGGVAGFMAQDLPLPHL